MLLRAISAAQSLPEWPGTTPAEPPPGSWVTLGIMLSSIAFALAAAASIYVVYRERHAAMNRVAYWHSVLVAAAVAAVAAYMGYWGLIGLRLWAWTPEEDAYPPNGRALANRL